LETEIVEILRGIRAIELEFVGVPGIIFGPEIQSLAAHDESAILKREDGS
jgi:hypothetical protein